MTNMSDVLQTADALAGKSPWTWLIVMFLGWVLVSGFMVRYTVIKSERTNEKLLEAEDEKKTLIREMCSEKEAILKEHNAVLTTIIKDVSTTQQTIAEVLKRIEKFLEKQ